jgi:uncharacterized membrane protein YhaH (DUF805 family)
MADSDAADSQLTLEEVTVSPPAWLDIPESASTLILEGTAVLGVVLVMIVGMALVFRRLRQRNEAFGANSIKALGLVLFLPSLMLLALVADFETETLAALLGVVAGYVLSTTTDRSNAAESVSRPARPASSAESTGRARGPARP